MQQLERRSEIRYQQQRVGSSSDVSIQSACVVSIFGFQSLLRQQESYKKSDFPFILQKVVLAVVQWTWKLGRGQNVIFCEIFKRCLGQLHVQVITELWCHLFLRLVYFKLMLHDLCCCLLIYHLSVCDFFYQTFPHTEVNVLHLYVA